MIGLPWQMSTQHGLDEFAWVVADFMANEYTIPSSVMQHRICQLTDDANSAAAKLARDSCICTLVAPQLCSDANGECRIASNASTGS